MSVTDAMRQIDQADDNLLQAAKDLPEDERDPWWTLLSYFNSLRELAIGVSLMQADVPEQLESIRQRRSLDFTDRRSIPHVMELTSRLESDQVPVALKKLEVKSDGDHPVDVCLASNIIEVQTSPALWTSELGFPAKTPRGTAGSGSASLMCLNERLLIVGSVE